MGQRLLASKRSTNSSNSIKQQQTQQTNDWIIKNFTEAFQKKPHMRFETKID